MSTVVSFMPRFRIVSIMPGMESRAPERTEIKSGFFGPPNSLPSDFSILARAVIDLLGELRRIGAFVFVVIGADFGRDRESGRNRKADAGHLGETGAFAAQQGAHRASPVGSSVTEVVNVFPPWKRGFRRLGFFGHNRKKRRDTPAFLGRGAESVSETRNDVPWKNSSKTTSGAGTDGKHFIQETLEFLEPRAGNDHRIATTVCFLGNP